MSETKIDKNIPFPSRNSWHAKYPFPEMEVGDSFFVPNKTTRDLCGTVAGWTKRHPGAKFTSRTVRENDIDGVRVWRVA